jgi:hypothetical protein
MSPVKYYEVEQTRTVKVWANSPEEAIYIASAEFAKEQPQDGVLPSDLQGRVVGNIEITNINATKEY